MPLTKLERLVKEFGKSVFWDWTALTANPNISMKFIRDNPHLHWDIRRGLANNPNLDEITVIRNIETIYPYELSKWSGLTCFLIDLIFMMRRNITPWLDFDIISRHIHVNEIEKKIDSYLWQWKQVSCNNSLTIDFVKKYPDKDWDWILLSRHRNITMTDIIDNPDLPWVHTYFSANPNLTFDAMKHFSKNIWSKYLLSSNPSLTIEMIKYVNSISDWKSVSWNMLAVSSHRNFTMKDIEDNPDIGWYYPCICANPNFTVEFFKKNMQQIINNIYELCGCGYSIHNIVEFIEEFPDYKWLWTNISSSKYITSAFIDRNSDKKWNYSNLSRNSHISQKYLEKNILCHDSDGMKWDIKKVSENCNFTFDFVKKYKDKLSFRGLSFNRFNYEHKREVAEAIFVSNNLNIPEDIKKYIVRNFI